MDQQKILDQINHFVESSSKDDQQKFPDLSDDSIAVLYSLAYHLYENGKYFDSKQVFRFLSLSDPFDRRYWMGLGASYQMLKDFKEALECYSVAAVQEPNDPYVHLHAADCLFATGDTQKGVKTLESAIIAAEKSDSIPLLTQLKCMHQSWVQGHIKNQGSYDDRAS